MDSKTLDARGCYSILQLDQHIDRFAMQNAVTFMSTLPKLIIVSHHLGNRIRELHKLDPWDNLEHRAIPCEER